MLEGIATNFASDILKWGGKQFLDKTKFGIKIKTSLGLIDNTFESQIEIILIEAYALYFRRYPERQFKAFFDFFSSEAVTKHLYNYLFNYEEIAYEELAQELNTQIGNDYILSQILDKQNLTVTQIIEDFIACYFERERSAIGFQSWMVMREVQRSEERLKLEIEKKAKNWFGQVRDIQSKSFGNLQFFTPLEWNLRKGEIKESAFFRNEGPLWIDFEKKAVYETRDVRKILLELSNHRIILIEGVSGTGKTVIVKNVGYKLATEKGWKVFISYIDETIDFDKLIREIYERDTEKCLFIFENIHNNLKYCSRLYSQLKNDTRQASFIFISRPFEKTLLSEDERINFSGLHQITITAGEHVVRSIVHHFLKFINVLASDADIKKIYDISGNDLWILTFLLSTWDYKAIPLSRINLNFVYEIISSRILSRTKYRESLLKLAALYQYEIPYQRDLLVETEEFLKEGIVTEGGKGNNFYLLYHTSSAKVYIDAAFHLHFSELRNFKTPKDFTFTFLKEYLIAGPSNLDTVIKNLMLNKEVEIVWQLTRDNEVRDSMLGWISKETELQGMESVIRYLREIDPGFLFELSLRIDLDSIKSRFETVPSLFQLSTFIAIIAAINPEVARSLLECLDLSVIVSEINREGDLWRIGTSLLLISNTAWDIADKLTQQIDFDLLLYKFAIEKNIECIGIAANGVSQSNSSMGRQILRTLNFDNIINLINNEEKIIRVAAGIYYLHRANFGYGYNLARKIDLDLIIKKINKERNISTIGNSLRLLSYANSNVTKFLIRRLDRTLIKTKVVETNNLSHISSLIQGLRSSDPNITWDIIQTIPKPSIHKKLVDEQSVGTIGNLLIELERSNNKYSNELVEMLSISNLSDKIHQEYRLLHVNLLIIGLYKINQNVARKLVQFIDPKQLKDKIIKQSNVQHLGNLIDILSKVDAAIANDLIKSLDKNLVYQKIEATLAIGYISELLRGINRANAKQSVIILKNIRGDLTTKINNEVNLASIGEFLFIVNSISHTIAEEVIEMINLTGLINKLYIEKNIAKSSILLWGLFHTKPDFVLNLLQPEEIERYRKKILQENNFGKIVVFFDIIGSINSAYASQILDSLAYKSIVQKIFNVSDIKLVNHFCDTINSINPIFTNKLVTQINLINLLIRMINEERNVDLSTNLINTLSKIDTEATDKIVKNINMDLVSSKLVSIKELKSLSQILLSFRDVDPRITRHLFRGTDFKLSLDLESDCGVIAEFLSLLYEIDPASVKSFVISRRPQYLAKIINDNNDIKNIAWYLKVIHYISESHGKEAINKVNAKSLINKFNAAEPWEKGWALWIFSTIHDKWAYDFGINIYSELTDDLVREIIKNEKDLFRSSLIAAGISVVYEWDLRQKEINEVIKRINAEKNMGKQLWSARGLIFAHPDLENLIKIDHKSINEWKLDDLFEINISNFFSSYTRDDEKIENLLFDLRQVIS
jgi:hypothetical protein